MLRSARRPGGRGGGGGGGGGGAAPWGLGRFLAFSFWRRRLLPCVPRKILPRLVRMSPLPMRGSPFLLSVVRCPLSVVRYAKIIRVQSSTACTSSVRTSASVRPARFSTLKE